MYSLTVLAGPVGSTVQFLFKEEKDAKESRDLFRSATHDTDRISIKDDFGTEGDFRRSEVFAVLLESLAGSGDAVIERTLQQAKTNLKAQNKAANDPTLKLHAAGGFPMNHPGAPTMGGQRRPG